MKTRNSIEISSCAPSLAYALVMLAGLPAQATTILADTFADGERDTQSLPNSSQWFFGGNGSTLSVVAPGGPLRMDFGTNTGSASMTTYFAAPGSAVTLVNPGDVFKLTWQFSVTGLGAANTSQNFRIAVVDTPDANRVATNTAPGNAAYAGYAMFMNMSAGNLGGSSPFQLMERTAPATESAFLSAGASWTGLANGATSGQAGYVEGTTYFYTMQFTLNSLGGLDIVSQMSGGSFNGTGTATVSFTDTAPNSLSFDTFGIRPSTAAGTAAVFNTQSLTVEFIPEPSTTGLFGAGLLGLCLRRRRNKV